MLQAEDDLLGHVGREELGLEVLEDHPDRAGQRADAGARDRLPEQADLAAEVGGQEAGHEAGETARER